MRKRVVTLALALAMALVPASALTACRDLASSFLPPTLPLAPTDAPSPNRPDPSVEPTHRTEPSNDPTPPASPSDEPPPQTPEPKPSAGVTLITDEHVSYISGTGPGLFSPDSDITRQEAALILYRLLADTVPVTVSYSDVPEDSQYADAAAQLGSLGVIRPNESTFEGDESISRGEFVSYIASFFPMRTDAEQFSDVLPDHPYADAILSGRASGWLSGRSDESFRPDDPLHRYEAVAIINRVLGRTGDRESIAENHPAYFLDVPATKWYYYDVMEAAVPHTFTVNEDGAEEWTGFTETDTGLPEDFRTEGLHLVDGWSYYYSEDAGDIVRDDTVAGNTYGPDGRFTTGDTSVDEQLRKIILSKTNSGMTQEEMLKAFFAYCRDNYKYLKWNTYNKGYTGFTLDAARRMLSTGRGNCYCFASVFWYLARWIGYDAKIFSGSVLNGPHSWVEIDGYIYDTQLEWRYVHDWGRSQYLWTFYHLRDSSDTFGYRK